LYLFVYLSVSLLVYETVTLLLYYLLLITYYSITLSLLTPRGGDETQAVRPWKGAVREPSEWKEPEDIRDAPDASLELK
jgi:hypothetical protein